MGPPVGFVSDRFPDPRGSSYGHVFLFPSSGGCTTDLHVTQIPSTLLPLLGRMSPWSSCFTT